jgi:AbrB family looped-hinge helix DNA binding protein
MHYSTITSKGQITIPSEVREILNLVPGNKIEFIPYDKYMLAIPLNQSVTSLKGILPKPKNALSCEEMNNIIREKYDDRS